METSSLWLCPSEKEERTKELKKMQKLAAFFSSPPRSLIERPKLRLTSLFVYSTSVTSSTDFLPSYLVTKCGFSPEKAAKAAQIIPRRVCSPDQPDSVIAFFKSHGFDNSHIKKIISTYPQALALSVEEKLVPKFDAFHELGFKGDDLITLVCSGPNVLDRSLEKQIVPMVNLLRRLLGSHNLLMKCLKNSPWQICCSNFDKTLGNISFLRDLGLSDHQISLIVTIQPYVISQKLESLSEVVSRVERLGLPRGSPNFHWALRAISMVSEDNLRAKVELFKGFGWSQDDFAKAFHKAPIFITASLKDLKKKMEFFLKEGGCTASYVALNPTLLMYSMEKRMIPRLTVLKALKEKGLCGGNQKLRTIMSSVNNKFFERYVKPYKDDIPELSLMFSSSS